MPWKHSKFKSPPTGEQLKALAKYNEALSAVKSDMVGKPPKPQLPGIHCPACGGALLPKINQNAYGCTCELVKINAIELLDGNCKDKGINFHKALLKAKMEIAAAYAVDKAFETQNFTYTGLDGKDIIFKNCSWSCTPLIDPGNPTPTGCVPPPKQEPLKADRSTIKLENLSPALQEFFKDYIKPDKVES